MSAQVAAGISAIIGSAGGAIALVLHALTYYRTNGRAQDNVKPPSALFGKPGS